MCIRDRGYELKDATVQMLGHARQVKVTKENTTIVGGAGDKLSLIHIYYDALLKLGPNIKDWPEIAPLGENLLLKVASYKIGRAHV